MRRSKAPWRWRINDTRGVGDWAIAIHLVRIVFFETSGGKRIRIFGLEPVRSGTRASRPRCLRDKAYPRDWRRTRG